MKRYWGLFIVLILSFWAVKELFTPGFFPMHDDTQVVRVHQMTQSLRDGHFPARWVKDLGYGYGYPLFNFYAPLPYYFGGIFGLLGVDALTATKMMMVIGVLLAGIFMYFLAREFWGEMGGVISGLFYMYAPYHAVDIYVRGAVGEFWAYAFLPLFALGLYKKSLIIGSIGFAGVILSHNLTALMLIPFLVIALLLYFFIAIKKGKLFIILLGLGLSAFYWLPALLELRYTNVTSQIGGGADFRDHFICWQQLWQSKWGFGGSAPGCIDGLTFKIGKLHIISVLSVILFLFLRKRFHYNNTYHHSVVFFAFLGFIVAVFFTLEPSRFIWETIAPMVYLQYPWRFLVFASFFSSFLAGATILLVNNRWSGAVLIFLLYFNVQLFQPQTIFPKTASDYVNEHNIKWTTSKISDEYMVRGFAKPNSEIDIVQQRVSFGEVKADKTQELIFTINEPQDRELLINVAPFPAWEVLLDGKRTDYISSNNGIRVLIPKGQHEVRLVFLSTIVEKLANTISLISVLTLVGAILLELRWKKFLNFQSSFPSGTRKTT